MLAGTQGSATEPTQQAGVGEASRRGARLPRWAFCIPEAYLFAHSGPWWGCCVSGMGQAYGWARVAEFELVWFSSSVLATSSESTSYFHRNEE